MTNVTALPTYGQFPTPNPGDEVLVDTSAYGLPGEHWCQVIEIRGPLYPLHLLLPAGARKRCSVFGFSEMKGWRPA